MLRVFFFRDSFIFFSFACLYHRTRSIIPAYPSSYANVPILIIVSVSQDSIPKILIGIHSFSVTREQVIGQRASSTQVPLPQNTPLPFVTPFILQVIASLKKTRTLPTPSSLLDGRGQSDNDDYNVL
ncbi:hypothetical protein BDR07DRAFT_1427687 [Suillus spraguei]|nr:hypothetical protein BDR07DRAFT_1427687 [Suillus spraguei]